MRRRVSNERIDKFTRDRILLPYDDVVIARRMKIDPSNYSKAVKAGRITNAFLVKFYTAFKDELTEIEDGNKAENDKILEYVDEAMQIFNNKYEELIRSHQGISEELLRLEQKFDRIMEQRLANIETMVASIVKSGGRSSP